MAFPKTKIENALSADSAEVFLKLEFAELHSADGIKIRDFSLDDWPILLFLRALGFTGVHFRTAPTPALEKWAERIAAYEQTYLADPDSLKIDECHWNEIDPDSSRLLVECVMPEPQSSIREGQHPALFVPPMMAPLGISEDARLRFIEELNHQSAVEVVSRFGAILLEYRQANQKIDPDVWAFLIGDIISICLEHRILDKAVTLAEEHRKQLQPLWSHLERLKKILGSFDPKASEMAAWSKIFDSLENSDLLHHLEHLLGSEAGPQVLKLLNHRSHTNPENLAEHCFRGSEFVQKILLQRLNHHWKIFHYVRLFEALQNALKINRDGDLIRLWVLALIQSSRTNAFDDLEKLFKPKFFSIRSNAPEKRMILNALSEYPSADCHDFLKRIRKYVQGELADQVEKLLHGYREVKA